MSNYTTFSNSPISKVDPNGDSDYYTADGNYIGSDGTDGTDIFVVTNQTVVNNIKAQSGEILAKDKNAYVEVKIELNDDDYFKLPTYEERKKIEKKRSEMDYENGIYEIGGSVSKRKDGSLNVFDNEEGAKNPLPLDDACNEVDEGKKSSINVPVFDEKEEVQEVEYTWHVHPDKGRFVKDPITNRWGPVPSGYTGKVVTLGGLTPSSDDKALSSKHNFLFTRTGNEVLYFRNANNKTSTTRMNTSFFFNTQAKKKPTPPAPSTNPSKPATE